MPRKRPVSRDRRTKKERQVFLTFCNTFHPADVLAFVLHSVPFYGKVHFLLDIHHFFQFL